MNNVVFYYEGEFPIIVRQHGHDQFVVKYGLEMKHGNYTETCSSLGQALLHEATLAGKVKVGQRS